MVFITLPSCFVACLVLTACVYDAAGIRRGRVGRGLADAARLAREIQSWRLRLPRAHVDPLLPTELSGFQRRAAAIASALDETDAARERLLGVRAALASIADLDVPSSGSRPDTQQLDRLASRAGRLDSAVRRARCSA